MSVTSLHQMDGTSSATATGDVELTQLPVAVLMQRRLAPTGDFTSEAPSCGPRSPLSPKTCGSVISRVRAIQKVIYGAKHLPRRGECFCADFSSVNVRRSRDKGPADFCVAHVTFRRKCHVFLPN